MAAVPGAQLEKALFLLDHRADPNVVDARGFTALHRAAELGHLDLAKVPLERGQQRVLEEQNARLGRSH